MWLMYCMHFDFVLPSVSVGVDETIEWLKEEKLAGRCVIVLNGFGVWKSVSG